METWSRAEDSLSCVKISATGSSVNTVLETDRTFYKKPSNAH